MDSRAGPLHAWSTRRTFEGLGTDDWRWRRDNGRSSPECSRYGAKLPTACSRRMTQPRRPAGEDQWALAHTIEFQRSARPGLPVRARLPDLCQHSRPMIVLARENPATGALRGVDRRICLYERAAGKRPALWICSQKTISAVSTERLTRSSFPRPAQNGRGCSPRA
jgi:hypothetical protein